MAAVFLVLILYHLPIWRYSPAEILNFILLVGLGLLIDCAASILKFKRLWCCVSGAVTSAIISLLTVGVPLWGRLLGVAAALILGKHLLGGTGKNILNPAMIGLLAVLVFFNVPYPSFGPTYLLIPAMLLSLVFLMSRPFAGIGYIMGMAAALIFYQELTIINLMTYGVFFWGCLVMTDPVTVTPHPVVGAAAGFLAGFAALYYFPLPVAIIAGILAVNLLSEAVDSIIYKGSGQRARSRIPKAFIARQPEVIDLTGQADTDEDAADAGKLSADIILARIRDNEVFGMGGAAFSTYQKIMTVMEAKADQKYLILNGAECDPGLIHDKWLLKNHYDDILQGVKLLESCIKFQSIHLAVKDNNGLPEIPQVVISKVPDSYPIGAERILIAKVLGRNIAYDHIPASEGILVLNVQTLYAIGQAVLNNSPTDARYLTVADLRNKKAKVVKARLGTKLHEILESVYPGAVNVFAGGGIMQAHLAEEDAVLDRTVNFVASASLPVYKESPQCSKCGNCSRNCPSSLKVNVIADLVDQGKLEGTAKYHAYECISCGSCSYHCLAGRNLSAKVKRAKDALKQV
jgi:ferredoxin